MPVAVTNLLFSAAGEVEPQVHLYKLLSLSAGILSGAG